MWHGRSNSPPRPVAPRSRVGSHDELATGFTGACAAVVTLTEQVDAELLAAAGVTVTRAFDMTVLATSRSRTPDTRHLIDTLCADLSVAPRWMCSRMNPMSTPHCSTPRTSSSHRTSASAGEATRDAMGVLSVDNVAAALAGRPALTSVR